MVRVMLAVRRYGVELLSRKPSPRDGIKYTRFAIVRNTNPMLRTTTLKTWLELMPEHVWGPVKYSPPITHHIKLPPRRWCGWH